MMVQLQVYIQKLVKCTSFVLQNNYYYKGWSWWFLIEKSLKILHGMYQNTRDLSIFYTGSCLSI